MLRQGLTPLRVLWGGFVCALVALNALPAGAVSQNGLIHEISGPCAGIYSIPGTGFCTHGSDPFPGAVANRDATARGVTALAANAPAAVMCNGDGVSGKRVQALYAYVSGRPDRRTAYLASFRSWAANVDAAMQASAMESGGYRHLRWVTGSDCKLAVTSVALSAASEANFSTTIAELALLGYNRSDRKYLVWFDSDPHNSSICGIGTIYPDDKTILNLNDNMTGYARADYMCWNWSESHELMHTLGGVQLTAPHSSGGMHCTDEYDQMCYADSPAATLTYSCADSHDQLFDCGHDDYFSVVASPSSYLATHWNTANSGWLVNEPPDTAPPVVTGPQTSFVAGLTLGSSVRVDVHWPAATDPSGVAGYELQRRKGSGAWTDVPLARATDTHVDLDLDVGATHAFRLRATDGLGNTSAWTTTAPRSLTVLQENAPAVTYTSGFTRVALSGASGGYVRKSTTTGNVATLTFSSTEIAFVTTLGSNRGVVAVRVDSGAWQNLDLYAAATKTKRVVWASSLASGSHRFEVRVTGAQNAASSGPRLDIDAFLVWAPV